MENNIPPQNNTEINTTDVNSVPHEETLEELAGKRDIEIKQKKKLFNKIRFVFFLLFLTSSGLIGMYVWYNREQAKMPSKPIVVPIENPSDPTQTGSDSWELRKDNDLRIFIKVPPEAKLYTYNTPTSKLEIIYNRGSDDFSKINETNLSDGYIFRITPLSLGIRNLETIADIKRDSFKLKCPDTAVITAPEDVLLDTVDAITFNITNCGVDYKLTYVPRFGIYYEIAEISKGDIGVRQQYSAMNHELLQTFRFFPEDNLKPYDPFISFVSEEYKFMFRYPDHLSTTCCKINGPASKFMDKIIRAVTAGDLATYKDLSNADVIGVFVDTGLDANKNDFLTYMEIQKQMLVEDYKIVTGRLPETSSSDVNLGIRPAIKLTGYTWAGNDLIYTAIPGRNNVLVLSTKNSSGETFNSIIEGIMQSFEFFGVVTEKK